MKKIFCFACTLLLFACGGGDDAGGGGSQTGGSEYLNVSNVDIPGGNTTATLNIQASNNCEWVISWSDSWIRSITPAKGRGSQNATITVTTNPSSTKEQIAVITVRNLSGTIERFVAITQLPNTEVLSISPQDQINFSADGGSQEVTITSNTHWTITGKPNWVRISKTEGDGNGSIIVSVDSNTDNHNRETTLTFKGEQISRQLKITQDAVSNSVVIGVPTVSNITTNGADISFSFYSSKEVSSYGICYSSNTSPTINDDKIEINSSVSEGVFNKTISNLRTGTTYYLRAYVVIDGQVVYSDQQRFTTTVVRPDENGNIVPSL